MSWRWVPPAFSPVTPAGLLRGALSAPGLLNAAGDDVAGALARKYNASMVTLTDSGTSALTLALRIAAPAGGTVAFPAYSCVDLITAAQGAGVRVRLYDVQPSSLSPDIDSLRQTVQRGVAALVLAPLFGYPMDVAEVMDIAARAGVPVIEDAAQGAGAMFREKRIGSFGAISILSFARGKGTTAGSGGALLVRDPALIERARAITSQLAAAGPGWGDVVKLGAQWVLGRPSLYGIPSSIPALRLGEMIYHPPHEPRHISRAARGMLSTAVGLDDAEIAIRRARVLEIRALPVNERAFEFITPVVGGVPGYLRLALLDRTGKAAPLPRAGVLRGYPMTMDGHEMSRTVLLSGESAGAGAQTLRDRLFTLPVHSRINTADVQAISSWLG